MGSILKNLKIIEQCVINYILEATNGYNITKNSNVIYTSNRIISISVENTYGITSTGKNINFKVYVYEYNRMINEFIIFARINLKNIKSKIEINHRIFKGNVYD